MGGAEFDPEMLRGARRPMPGDVRMSGGPLKSGVISRGWPEGRAALADSGDDFSGAVGEEEGGAVTWAWVGVMDGGDARPGLGGGIGEVGAGAVGPGDGKRG